ncbi:hypothetical protein CDS [Bradyrhizobium sp.]|nr:hypothetical protein CDS [Bradyrhizobium sp.]
MCFKRVMAAKFLRRPAPRRLLTPMLLLCFDTSGKTLVK